MQTYDYIFLAEKQRLTTKQKLPDDTLLPGMIHSLGKLELSAESIRTRGRLSQARAQMTARQQSFIV